MPLSKIFAKSFVFLYTFHLLSAVTQYVHIERRVDIDKVDAA